MGKIEIFVDAKVLYQMYEYAAFAKHHFQAEVAGWGHYNKDKGIYKLAPLTKQEVSGAEVNNFPNEILSAVDYNISDMLVQWHSHVDMGVTPSATDVSTIKETLKITPCLISIIVNCKHEYSARLDFARTSVFDLPNPVTFEVELIPYYINKEVSKEIKRKLYRPKPKPIPVVTTEHKDVPKKIYYTREGEYGYWDSLSRMFVPQQQGSEQLKLVSVDTLDLEIAISKMIGVSKDNYGEYEYCPSSLNNGLGDLLIHIPTGDFMTVDDFNIRWGKRIGNVSLIDEFVKHTKGKKNG